MQTTVSSNALLLVILAFSIIGPSFPTIAQTEKKTLTNADVVQMVTNGLAETVVIGLIAGNPGNYDTSPSALIELNKQGVSAKVQEAILAAQKKKEAPANPPASPDSPVAPAAVPTITMPNTVVYLDGTNRMDMKQSQGKMDSSYGPFHAKISTVFDGIAAQFRVTTNLPGFEVTLMSNFEPSEWVYLIKPKVTKKQREIFLGGAAPFTQIKADRKKDTVPLVHEEARKESSPGMQLTTYRVKPAAALPVGEYVLSVQGAYYCFGVDAAK